MYDFLQSVSLFIINLICLTECKKTFMMWQLQIVTSKTFKIHVQVIHFHCGTSKTFLSPFQQYKTPSPSMLCRKPEIGTREHPSDPSNSQSNQTCNTSRKQIDMGCFKTFTCYLCVLFLLTFHLDCPLLQFRS